MALNNTIGLGFNFGAQDSGFQDTLKKVMGGIAELGDMAKSFNQQASKLDPSKELDKSATKSKKAGGKFKDLIKTLGEDLSDAVDGSGRRFQIFTRNLSKDTRTASLGFGLIERAVGTLEKLLSQSRLQTWIQAISLGRLGDVAKELGELSHQGLNLTTSLEGQITANNKSTKALAANMGYAGQAAQKFSGQAGSMAISLNISAEAAGKAQYAWDQGADVLKAVGIDSADTAAKMGEVFGIDMSKFIFQLKQTKSEFGLTDEQLNNVVGSLTAFGKQSGDVSGALGMLPDLLTQMREQAHALGIEMSGQQLADFATDTASLATGFYSVTNNMEDAKSMAMGLGKSMLQSRADMGKLFAGTADDIPAMVQELGIATSDINNAFALMQKGPAGMTAGLAQMVLAAKKNGKGSAEAMNFFKQRLEAAVGPEQASMLMSFFEKADDSTLAMMADTKSATANLGKMAKEGFSTGHTLAESFELAENQFVMRFRNISRKEAVKFVDDTTKEFDRFATKLKGIADEGGPLGFIVKKFSEMHQLGVQALLPQTLRPMAAVFGTMIKEGTPLIGMLGSLGLRFGHLTNPITLAAAALGGYLLIMKGTQKAAVDEAEALAADGDALWELDRAAKKAADTSMNFFGSKEDWLKLETKSFKLARKAKWAHGLKDERAELTKLLKYKNKDYILDKKTGKTVRTEIAQRNANIAAIHEEIKAEAKLDAQTRFKEGVKAAVDKAIELAKALPEILKTVWVELQGAWKDIRGPLLGALKMAWDWLRTEVYPIVRDFLKSMWEGLVSGSKAESGSTSQKVGSAIGVALHQAFVVAIDYIKAYLTKWWAKMGTIWGDSSTSFTDKVKDTVKNSAGLLVAGFALAKFTPVFGILGSLAGVMGGVVRIATGFGAVLIRIIALLPGMASGVYSVLSTLQDVGVFMLTNPIGWIATLVAVAVAFALWPDKAKAAMEKVGNFIRDALSKIVPWVLEAVAFVVKGVLTVAWTIVTKLPEIITAAAKAVVAVVVMAVKAVLGVLDGIANWLKEKIPWASWLIDGLFGAIKLGVQVAGAVTLVWLAAMALKYAWMAASFVASTIWSTGVYLQQMALRIWASRQFYWAVLGHLKFLIVQELKFFWTVAQATAIYVKDWIVANAQVVASGVWATVSLTLRWVAFFVIVAGWAASWALQMIGHYIKVGIQGAWAAMATYAAWLPWIALAALIGLAVYGIIQLWDKLPAFFKGLWNGIVSVVTAIWNGLVAAAKWVWGVIKTIAMAPVRLIQAAWSALTGFFGSIWSGIKSIFSSGSDETKKHTENSSNSIAAMVQKTITQFDQVTAKSKEASTAAGAAATTSMTKSLEANKTAVRETAKVVNTTTQASISVVNAVSSAVDETKRLLIVAGKLAMPGLTKEEIDLDKKRQELQDAWMAERVRLVDDEGTLRTKGMDLQEELAKADQKHIADLKALGETTSETFGVENKYLAASADDANAYFKDLTDLGVGLTEDQQMEWKKRREGARTALLQESALIRSANQYNGDLNRDWFQEYKTEYRKTAFGVEEVRVALSEDEKTRLQTDRIAAGKVQAEEWKMAGKYARLHEGLLIEGQLLHEKGLSTVLRGGELTESVMQAALSAYVGIQAATDSKMRQLIANMAPAVRGAVEERLKVIEAGHQQELKSFLATTKLQGAELDAAVAVINTKYKGLTANVGTELEKQQVAIASNTTANVDAVAAGIAAQTEAVKKEVGGTIDVAASLGSEVQKSIGVSVEASAGIMKELINIEPELFRARITLVGGYYQQFLGESIGKTKEVVSGAQSALATFNEELGKGWKAVSENPAITSFWNVQRAEMLKLLSFSGKDQEGVVKAIGSFLTEGLAAIEKVLSDSLAGTITNAFGKAFQRVVATIRTQFNRDVVKEFRKTFDLIAQEFQNIWDRLLQLSAVAFDKLAADLGIAMSRARALTLAQEATASTTQKAPPPIEVMQVSQEDMDQALLEAVHWPNWYSADFRQLFLSLLASSQETAANSGQAAAGGRPVQRTPRVGPGTGPRGTNTDNEPTGGA